MNLMDLAPGTKFRIVANNRNPPGAPDPGDRTLILGNIDGMYSFCQDEQGNVFHPIAWAEVERVDA